jgi:hypothetical protein
MGRGVDQGGAMGERGAMDEARDEQASAFRGYNPIRYTPCPDEFFDQQMAEMDDDELRVTLYAFRRTFGFKKTDDAISISQFLQGITTRDGRQLDRGCGLKTARQVLSGLAKAERRRTLLSAFFCRACGARVPDEAMLDEERTQRLVNGQRKTYQVRVVPRLCPACGARLRGFEEKRYGLNVLEETSESAPTPSIRRTDPPRRAAPSVRTTDPLYPRGKRGSASETETRDRGQQDSQQESVPGRDDVDETITAAGEPATAIAPVFLPPGSRLPSPQLWATALAQAAGLLDRADREGWLRATALLAAERDEDGAALTLVVGVPTEHARRRCGARAGDVLAEALAGLLGQAVRVRPEVTAVWLREQERGRADR